MLVHPGAYYHQLLIEAHHPQPRVFERNSTDGSGIPIIWIRYYKKSSRIRQRSILEQILRVPPYIKIRASDKSFGAGDKPLPIP